MDSSKTRTGNLEMKTIASEQHGTHLFVTNEDFCKWRRQNLSRYIGSTFNDIKDELEEKFGANFINYYARHIRMWLARKK